MKLGITIAVFVVTLLISGSYVYSQRSARNSLYEFCTTRAYGWPFAWQIDNCECDGQGGQTEFPPLAKIWSASAALMLSVVAAGTAHLALRSRR